MLDQARNAVADNNVRLPSSRYRRTATRVGQVLLHGFMLSLLMDIGSATAARAPDTRAYLTRKHSGSSGRPEAVRHTRRSLSATISHDAAPNFRLANARRTRASAPHQLSQELFRYQNKIPRSTTLANMTGANGTDTSAEASDDRRSKQDVLARGIASWYSADHYNKLTASGSRFDENALTAAHSWLPLGTRVRVTVEGTNDSVVVTINDRLGMRSRVIDLSKGAARQLGILSRGLAKVTLTRS